jgi:hypothetical protein
MAEATGYVVPDKPTGKAATAGMKPAAVPVRPGAR